MADLAHHLLQRENAIAKESDGFFAEAATVGADVVSLKSVGDVGIRIQQSRPDGTLLDMTQNHPAPIQNF